MTRSEFRFVERLRVRWVEVDMQKIVFNGHYLMYFDTAVAGYWRALALPYHETMDALGGDFFVRKATLEYLGSARYDDVCDVGIRCARLGNSSMTFAAAVFRGEHLLVHGELLYVFADPATQTSQPVPPLLREWLAAFEAGAPMVRAQVGAWSELGDAARRIRQRVFVEEQGMAAGFDIDSNDTNALHALAINRAGIALAAGRALLQPDGVAKIGRIAVLAPMRGNGVGRVLLDALLGAARASGASRALLDARSTVVPFYRRAGFRLQGEPFEEAGVVHQAMTLEL